MARAYPWVVFRLDDELFGISVEHVASLVKVESAVSIPESPAYVRGVMDLRGKVIQLIDMRLYLGMKSLVEYVDDFCGMMDQRRKDHENWLSELRASTQEKRQFRLTTDPHKCAFGRWYDSFTTNDSTLNSILACFDEPHKKIHGIAEQVEAMKNANPSEAMKIISTCWNTELATMINIFDNLKNAIHDKNKEVALVLDNGLKGALIVDEVKSVEHLNEKNFESTADLMPWQDSGNIAFKIGQRPIDKTTVMLLPDPEELFCMNDA